MVDAGAAGIGDEVMGTMAVALLSVLGGSKAPNCDTVHRFHEDTNKFMPGG